MAKALRRAAFQVDTGGACPRSARPGGTAPARPGPARSRPYPAAPGAYVPKLHTLPSASRAV
ncbi:hypothetical protein GGE06_001140 [Streptomyces sp. SFB5A]|uniref:Uncharacterized protein n=1 Tax=Streptomyces nymphaeiformis TaxID=2663842 RepID=A0A7W7X9V1_9ACTN|nr:hypothetical protein [Streptomyces nymphaeiformis]